MSLYIAVHSLYVVLGEYLKVSIDDMVLLYHQYH